MKTRIVLVIVMTLSLSVQLMAGAREEQWREVDAAAKSGLPKTAIDRLNPIIAAAMAEKVYPEAIRGIARRVVLEASIQGDKAEDKIGRLQAELETAPAPMKPLMETILAHWYWEFFQQNRWKFLQRTQTTSAPGADISAWDLARILTEIEHHFSAALADEATLKATHVSAYDELLVQGSVADKYRPTLYDLIVHEALQFYQAGEQAATVGEDEFEIDSDGPIFSETGAFLVWQSRTGDTKSPKYKAIQLYQRLLKFHEMDADRSAYLDADLARIAYGHNVAVGDRKDDRYKAALERFVQVAANHESSTRAIAALAKQLYSEGDAATAHQVARRGVDTLTGSAGGAACFNLIQEIEARSIRLDTERVWCPPWPTVGVTYRNVAKIYFRAIAVDFARYVQVADDHDGFKGLVMGKPTLEWDADLPETADFKERTEQLLAPTSLKPGFYLVAVSNERKFGETGNYVSVAPVWVSDLALVIRERYDGGPQTGLVLDAKTGEPVAGATVRYLDPHRPGRVAAARTSTDENGRFEFSAKDREVVILVEHRGQFVSSARAIRSYGNERANRFTSAVVFFTDRALYRPGQTINYKGVAVFGDQGKGSYGVSSDEKITVVFKDPSGQEIARAIHETNDYGSFSGVFTAPRDRVTGRMSIEALDESGRASFSVEEYKRPKFQVAFDPTVEAPKLREALVVKGHATAYTGVSVGGARVRWRVERAVELPSWCWWWRPPGSKAIAHGSAVTEPDGSFKIEYVAEPDEAVPSKNEPVFLFRVYADVTDTTGETRSEQCAIRVGYTAVQASLTANEWQTPQKPVELKVVTSSLNGSPQSVGGRVTIYALKQPSAVARAPVLHVYYGWPWGVDEPKPDATNPDSWELGSTVEERTFSTDATGNAQISVLLAPGIYRASVNLKDRLGNPVTARYTLQVVDPRAHRYGVKLANHFSAPKWSVEPGETFNALWSTGYEKGRAFVEFECNGKLLKSHWTKPDQTQDQVELPITESMRGGLTVRITYVHENRAYVDQRVVNVPWSNKEMSIKWEHFRSKLAPGQKETWTAVITGPKGKSSAAEMVAGLYDASLDQYLPHSWPEEFGVFRRELSASRSEFQNTEIGFRPLLSWNAPAERNPDWRYRSFPSDIVAYSPDEETIVLSPFEVASANDTGYRASNTLAGTRLNTELRDVGSAVSVMTKQFMRDTSSANNATLLRYVASTEVGGVAGNFTGIGGKMPDLTRVSARKNLNETAFFFPQLVAGADGTVKMVFTIPEALTEWKFLGFAHDAEIRSGFLSDTVVTVKDLMVEPNPPRFLREGDEIEFTVKVSNRTDRHQVGKIRLTFSDAESETAVDNAIANRTPEQPFEVPGGESRTYSWRILVPDGLGFVSYKVVAATSEVSDGEEGFLPILSRRALVAESLPLPIRGPTTKSFEFKNLLDSGASSTLRQQSLTVQMVSQPAWYAVMALPYLMEFPHECSEQLFSRYYANVIGRHIVESDPKIRRVFDSWKNTPALDSPLEKNQDLKSVILEETPWLRHAKSESQARRNVGLLFDSNRLDEEAARALRTLSERQSSDGLWSWFPGGRPSDFISLYVVTGFGRLRHLGANVDAQPAVKALAALDAAKDRDYHEILKRSDPEKYVPTYVDALYLYGRSFFLADQPIAKEHHEAVEFFLRQSRTGWLQSNCRQSQAQLAIALQRFGDKETPQAIMKSLKERSVTDVELGMFWRDQELSWWWYDAPIETQALMIEAFAEVARDAQAVEDCKVWLLKQKQTQDWKTTKATADAVYALLLHGEKLLNSQALVEVTLGNEAIKPQRVEAGTGFYERTFVRDEIRPAMGRISVKKRDSGVSWGSVHWQYLEDIAKIAPHVGTRLTLRKTLWIKEATGQSQILKPVSGPVSVGDELVVRIELRTDRDMEFVHLKDQRGSGTEPVTVLSRYKYQDGLGYYESTRDTASHFFIDYLPKGTYVFEYSTRVQLRGSYQTGIAEVQCMYAPEFNSHSESIVLDVQ